MTTERKRATIFITDGVQAVIDITVTAEILFRRMIRLNEKDDFVWTDLKDVYYFIPKGKINAVEIKALSEKKKKRGWFFG